MRRAIAIAIALQSQTNLSEGVNQIPPELREATLHAPVQAKLQDKKRVGWDEVHRWLFLYSKTPRSEKLKTATPSSPAVGNVTLAGAMVVVGPVG